MKDPLIDQDWLEETVLRMVDHPDSVSVSEVVESDRHSVLTVTVDPQDLGKVIGRNGRHIEALRLLASCAAAGDGRTVTVELNEPNRQKKGQNVVELGPDRKRRSRFRPRQAAGGFKGEVS